MISGRVLPCPLQDGWHDLEATGVSTGPPSLAHVLCLPHCSLSIKQRPVIKEMPLCNVMTQPLGETERSLKATVLQTMIGQLVTDRWLQRLCLRQVRCPADSLEQWMPQHRLQRLRLNQSVLTRTLLLCLDQLLANTPKMPSILASTMDSFRPESST